MQQQVTENKEQLGKTVTRLAQDERTLKGGVPKNVSPNGQGNIAERFSTMNNNGNCEGTSNQCENNKVQQSGCGVGERNQAFAGSRRIGNWSTGSAVAHNGTNPPGFQGRDLRRNTKKQQWDTTHKGLTDLGKKKYSFSWLMGRRDKEKAQGSVCDLPDSLQKEKQAVISQQRRYPYPGSPSNQQPCVNGGALLKNENPNSQKNIDKNMKEKQDDVLSQSQPRGFQIKEATINATCQENNFIKRTMNETPAHRDNLFAPTTTKPSSTGLMAKVAEAMNVQSVHSCPPMKTDRSGKMQQNLSRAPTRVDRSGNNRFVQNSNHSAGQDNRLIFSDNRTADIGRQRNRGTSDYNFKHGNHPTRDALSSSSKANYSNVSRDFSPKSLADTYPDNPSAQKNKAKPEEQQRFSISCLKESEKVQVIQMLNEKLKKYSVKPNMLAYASASASKFVKIELRNLGYVEVPTPHYDVGLNKEEKTVLSFQHEIRKHYRSAIAKANEYSKYQDYRMKTSKRKLKYGGSKFY